MSEPYIYNVEFSIEKIDIYEHDTENADEIDKIIQFKMNPKVLLDLSEDEIIQAINCGEKKLKHNQFVLSDDQLKEDLEGYIIAKKVTCNGNHVVIGTHKISQLNKAFSRVKSRYDEQQTKNQMNSLKTQTQISSNICELAPLENENKKSVGSVIFNLRITCFGPRIVRDLSVSSDFDGFLSGSSLMTSKMKQEEKCLSNCRGKECYDEYLAEINGNSLIIRISKNSPYTVTRVFDTCSSKDKLTIQGCNQKIDFKFPTNFQCKNCLKTFGTCKCVGDSHLTDFQKQTSCAGKSFKNAFTLPVIRGNLKYPSRFEDQSIDFNVFNDCESTDTMNKYRMQPAVSRNVCAQVDDDNMKREMKGDCKIPKGIKMCKLSCQNEADVFVLKLGKKGRSRDGKNHEIELEMRTPKSRNVGQKQMETREIQVIEDEFEDLKKTSKKENGDKEANDPKKKKEVKGVKTVAVSKTVKKTVATKQK